MKLAALISLSVALSVVLGSGMSARGQDFGSVGPPPFDQPAYQPVKALIERQERCAGDIAERWNALKEAQKFLLFPTRQERENDREQKRTALAKARACEAASYKELVDLALPTLETQCRGSENAPCAEWASTQRLWRRELRSAEMAVEGCVDTAAAAAVLKQFNDNYKHWANYEQERRDKALVAKDMAEAMEPGLWCRAILGRHMLALHDGLAGRDRAAEARAKETEKLAALARKTRANVIDLMSAARTLIEKGQGPEVGFASFRESCSQFAANVQQATFRKTIQFAGTEEALRTLNGIAQKLEASEDAWASEREWQHYIDRLTQELNTTPRRSSEGDRLEREIAEEHLKHAIAQRDRAHADRIGWWRAAEDLVNSAPRLAEDTYASR